MLKVKVKIKIKILPTQKLAPVSVIVWFVYDTLSTKQVLFSGINKR